MQGTIRKITHKKFTPLILILFLYLALVLFRFFHQGLINVDEANSLIVAQTYATLMTTALTHPSQVSSSDFYRNLMASYGNTYTTSRPAFVILGSIIDVLYHSEYSTRIVSVLAGAGIIIYFYRILLHFEFERRIAFISTLMVSVSPLLITYARTGLTHITAGFFMLSALFYALQYQKTSTKRSLILFSLSSAGALLSYYLLIPALGVMCIYGGYILIKKKAPRSHALIGIFSFLFPIVVWEVITRIGVFMSETKNLGEASKNIMPYTGELIAQWSLSHGVQFILFDQPLYYIKLLFNTEHLIIFALFVIGICVLIKKVRTNPYQTLIVCMVPYGIYISLIFLKFPRTLTPILPFIYIVVAFGLRTLYTSLSRALYNLTPYRYILLITIGVMLTHGLYYKNLFTLETGIKNITAAIKSTYNPHTTVIYTASPAIWRAYLREFNIQLSDKMPQQHDRHKTIVGISDWHTTIAGTSPFDAYRTNIQGVYPYTIYRLQPLMLDSYYGSKSIEDFFPTSYKKETQILEITLGDNET